MTLFTRFLLALVAAPLLLSAPAVLTAEDAQAAGVPGVRVDLLIDGRLAREYYANERIYVEAKKGREYAVRLSNDTSERVAVALAVDGLNTIDASHTSAEKAAKWVLSPYETITVSGWQVSTEHARKFVFTSEEKSYGAWIGDTRNLGLVSAVVYGEKTHCCRDPQPYSRRYDSYGSTGRDEDRSAPSAESKAPRRGAGKAQSPRQSEGEASAADSASGGRASDRSYRREAPKKKDERAATGSGRKHRNEVVWTEFELETNPLGSVAIRYGFKNELVELGVLPEQRRNLDRREAARGFAPDPGNCCR